MRELENKGIENDARDPDFSIVIPHLKYRENLYRCLNSIYEFTDESFEIILVDNGSRDMSVESIYPHFPDVLLVQTEQNLGFAGGCNAGIKKASGKYIVLLNDDTVMTPNWLKAVRDVFDKDTRCGVCQPKLLSYENRGFFEYSGSSGGFIDRYCYPFTRGRIFDTIERDESQYNDRAEIFWGAGAALIFRRELIDRVGLFDEDFFAHMEEIDFCFRVHSSGYKVISVPDSVIYHKTASTLSPNNYLKMYLNHRNSLYLMLKNYPLKSLISNLSIRMLLDISAFFYFLLKGEIKRPFAILTGYLSCLGELVSIFKKRRSPYIFLSDYYQRVFPKLFKKSIALEYFIFKKHRFSDLNYSITEVR